MKRGRRPVLITDAEQSQDDQLRRREIRYVVMMSFRALCLVAAAVLVGTHAPLLWLWIPLCLIGMVLVPWLAVMLANDRPPREKLRPTHRWEHDDPPEAGPAALTAQPVRIIDYYPGDPVAGRHDGQVPPEPGERAASGR